MEISKLNHFLRPLVLISNGNGDVGGYGHGHGNGNGDVDGYGHGHGYGDGNGDGHGNGYGHGNGNGYGDGNGNGHGDGYGNGNLNGHGIKIFNKSKVYLIDNIQTILTLIKNDVAKGFILNSDLTLTKCYIVRNDFHFAHNSTLNEALKSLEDKTTLTLPIPKRIENFKNSFKDFSKKIKASILYDWHYKLTGSCKMGRDNFCVNNNINLKKDKFTVLEFIELTKNSYGGDIIKQLI